MRFPRPKFSLRLALGGLTLFSVALGLYSNSAVRQSRAVEAVESVGGTVGYAHNYDYEAGMWVGGDPVGPEWLRRMLGRHYFDKVIDVRLNGGVAAIPEAGLHGVAKHLRNLRGIKHFSLWNVEADDELLAALVLGANPEELICGQMDVSDELAESIAKVRRIRDLGFNSVAISAEGLVEFQKLPELEVFWLSCKNHYTESNGEYIERSNEHAIGDDALVAFLEYPKLRKLSLSWELITNRGVELLSRIDRLESFGVTSPLVTDEAMDHIVKLKKLEWLSVGGTAIGDDSLPKLRELPRLSGLGLSARVTNGGLPSVARLTQLEYLKLGGEGIDDNGLVHLTELKKLQRLDIRSTGATPRGAAVAALQEAIPSCKIRQRQEPVGGFFELPADSP